MNLLSKIFLLMFTGLIGSVSATADTDVQPETKQQEKIAYLKRWLSDTKKEQSHLQKSIAAKENSSWIKGSQQFWAMIMIGSMIGLVAVPAVQAKCVLDSDFFARPFASLMLGSIISFVTSVFMSTEVASLNAMKANLPNVTLEAEILDDCLKTLETQG